MLGKTMGYQRWPASVYVDTRVCSLVCYMWWGDIRSDIRSDGMVSKGVDQRDKVNAYRH
jgi:hypothetical protein